MASGQLSLKLLVSGEDFSRLARRHRAALLAVMPLCANKAKREKGRRLLKF